MMGGRTSSICSKSPQDLGHKLASISAAVESAVMVKPIGLGYNVCAAFGPLASPPPVSDPKVYGSGFNV